MALKKQIVETKAVTPKEAPTVKVVQLHAGLDLIGSKTTMNFKDSDMYELPHGVMIVSKGTKRKVVVPYANIRGYELL